MTTYETTTPRLELLELTGAHKVTGLETTFRFSNRRFRTAPTDGPGSQPYLARVQRSLSMTRTVFENGRISGRSVADRGSATLKNADGALDYLVSDYTFAGRSLVRRYGFMGQSYDQLQVEQLIARDVAPGSDDLVIRARTRDGFLDRKAQPRRYHGQDVGLAFDGTSDYVTLPDEASPTAFEDFCFDAWVRHDFGFQASGGAIYGTGDVSSYSNDRFNVIAGSVGTPLTGSVAVNWDDQLIEGGPPIADNLLHHIGVGKTGTYLYLMLDGSVVAEATLTGSRGWTSDVAYIGATHNAGGNASFFFAGMISRVRLRKQFLDPDQLYSTAFQRLTGVETDLIAAYELNEGVWYGGGITGSSSYDAADRTDAYVFDSARNPAGTGIGVVGGAPTWELVGGGRAEDAGRRKIFPVGEYQNLEPDIVSDQVGAFSLGGPTGDIAELSAGGVLLNPNTRLEMDGVNDSVSISDDADYDMSSSDVRTLELGFRPNGAGPLFYYVDAGNVLVYLEVNNSNQLVWNARDSANNTTQIITPDILQDLARYWVTVSWQGNGGAHQIWIGNRLVGSKAHPSSAGNFNPDSGGMWVARDHSGSTFTACELELLRLTDRRLTQSEIEARQFQRIHRVVDTDMVLQHHYDEGTGTTITDHSLTANNATLAGGTWVSPDYAYDRETGLGQLNFVPTKKLRAKGNGWAPFGTAIYYPHEADDALTEVDVGNDASLRATGDFEFEMWFRQDYFSKSGSTQYLVDYLASGVAGGMYIRIMDDVEDEHQVRFAVQTSTGLHLLDLHIDERPGDSSTTFPFRTDDWHYVSVRWDDSEALMELQLDDVTTSQTVTGTLSGSANTSNMRFGSTGAQVLKNSSFQEVRWWHGLRTSAQRELARRRPLLGDEANLAGYWPGRGSGSTMYDMTTNENHGTLAGDAQFGEGLVPRTPTDLLRFLLAQRPDDLALGNDDLDLEALAAFDAVTQQPTIQGAFRDEAVADVAATLLAPDGWFGMSADGKFQLGLLRAPDVATVPLFGQQKLAHALFTGNADTHPQSTSRGYTISLLAKLIGPPRNSVADSAPDAYLCQLPGPGGIKGIDVRYLFATNTLRIESWVDDGSGTSTTLTTIDATIDLEDREFHRIHLRPYREEITVDGVALSTSVSTTTSQPHTGRTIATFAQETGLNVANWNGIIFDVAIYQTDVDDATLAVREETQLRGDESFLVVYLPFDDEDLRNRNTTLQTTAEGEPVSSFPVRNLAASAHMTLAAVDVRVENLFHDVALLPMTRRGSEEISDSRVVGKFQPAGHVPPELSQTLRYAVNLAPMELDDVSDLILRAPERIPQFTRPHLEAEWFVDEAKIHKLAVAGDPVETALVYRADAVRAAKRHALNRGRRRLPLVATVKGEVATLIGQRAQLEWTTDAGVGRFGLAPTVGDGAVLVKKTNTGGDAPTTTLTFWR